MTPYQEAWQKKRTLWSLGAALLLHLLLVGAFLIYGLFFRVDWEEVSGPVLIKLGEPEGADLPLPPPEAVSERAEPPAPAPEQTVREELPAEPAPPVESPAAPREERSDEAQRPAQEESAPPAAPQTAAAPPQPERADAAEPEPVTVKGEEAGNAHETVFATTDGQVGRNLWVPINLYMPLPAELEARYVDAVPGDALNTAEENQAVLRRYYRESPLGGYLKKGPVTFEERRTLWVLLEKGGYDLARAEYKEGRSLRPVVLSFRVAAAAGRLEEVRLERSSGYGDLDEAVLYGFRASQYFNAGDKDVKGRFTYRFD